MGVICDLPRGMVEVVGLGRGISGSKVYSSFRCE